MNEQAAKLLYLASLDDSIHCNRYPSWGELSESERQSWRDKAATPNEKASMGEGERAEFMAWVRDRGCDTDGAWSAWQAASAGKAKLLAALRRLQNAAAGGTTDFDGDTRKADEYVRAWRRINRLLEEAAKAERALLSHREQA